MKRFCGSGQRIKFNDVTNVIPTCICYDIDVAFFELVRVRDTVSGQDTNKKAEKECFKAFASIHYKHLLLSTILHGRHDT
jgi:hypothetical protein